MASPTQWRQFNPWVGKIPWRRKWQPTPIFLPGEFHGQRSMVGYSPWGHKELDMTEWLTPPNPAPPGDSGGQRSLASCSSWAAKSCTWLSDWTIYIYTQNGIFFSHKVASKSSRGQGEWAVLQEPSKCGNCWKGATYRKWGLSSEFSLIYQTQPHGGYRQISWTLICPTHQTLLSVPPFGWIQ